MRAVVITRTAARRNPSNQLSAEKFGLKDEQARVRIGHDQSARAAFSLPTSFPITLRIRARLSANGSAEQFLQIKNAQLTT